MLIKFNLHQRHQPTISILFQAGGLICKQTPGFSMGNDANLMEKCWSVFEFLLTLQ